MNRHMYILADGGRIAASGPSEFVRLLREGSWFDSGCTDKEYMMNFSGRYRELHGVTVRTDTPEHFMDDLKSTVTSRVERPVPLLLRSLPVHSSPVGIFSFFTVSDLRRILFSGGWFHDLLPQSFFSLFILLSTDCRTFTHNPGNIGKNPGLSPDCHLSYLLPALTIYVYI